jgi:hypothetical protein
MEVYFNPVAMGTEFLKSVLRRGWARQRTLIGRELAWRVQGLESINGFADVEFSVFSQCGDDGIIQWLIHRLPGISDTFVEFGVEDYHEANTRFLLLNDNWSGLVMDSSRRNIMAIKNDPISFGYDLQSKYAVVTAENIDQLLLEHGFAGDIGLLHIDIDGNDYWVWRAVTVVRPAIAIIEYNSVFGAERAITVPYDPKFVRRRRATPKDFPVSPQRTHTLSRRARISNLYFGASLPALCDLANSKGYDFVGSNTIGNNAYFIRSDLHHGLKPLTAAEGYVLSKFAESTDSKGRLNYLRGERRLASIRGMPVVNTRTGAEEEL